MSDSTPTPRKKPRRPRYRGTHPRRFDQRYKELDPQRFPDMHAHIRAQGRTPAGTHVPVLLREVIAALRPRPGDIVADCTLGFAGHAVELLRRILPGGRLIGFDLDAPQLSRAEDRLRHELATIDAQAPPETLTFRRASFAGIGTALQDLRLDGCDVILADLGLSSMQIDDPARGFSYKHDGPLDMRMDDRHSRTAARLLATLSEQELSDALRDLGDEPDHARIARAIAQQRMHEPIIHTRQLVDLILRIKRPPRLGANRAGSTRVHPAALAFQAVRMLVNDELAHLKQLLRTAPFVLRAAGRIGIISFHSGEDRLVKHALREGLRSGAYSAICDDVIRPTAAERRDNPRSTSAKLRWAVRSAAPPAPPTVTNIPAHSWPRGS